jgi:tetratricopeptide (TPR) repeat protein
MIKKFIIFLLLFPAVVSAQINTERVMAIGRNALYFEDYVLSIQYFNQVVSAKPYLYEPYFFRALAKINLDDYQGAEIDCSAAIERNPFVVNAYQMRGLSRIKQNKFDGAIEDYTKALSYDPENVGVWHNLALCKISKKDYKGAESDLSKLIALSPQYTKAYLMRAEVSLKQKDTIMAMKDYDLALKVDKYDSDVWSSRAAIKLQQGKYKDAEADYDQATYLNTKNSGNYINRALARFHQNKLQGALEDYDVALDIDPNNFIGHYNRGLLRAQVGDDNRAIDDFNFVIKMEPDNMMAIFNRGILRKQTGDFRGAIKDFTSVIKVHPNFLAGYYNRAEARRRIGDIKGADLDEFKVMKTQLDKRFGIGQGKKSAKSDKTRKKSDKDMENYSKIVVADDSESEQKYKSEYRGKVQDKNVEIRLEPMFALTYYEKSSEIKRDLKYHKYIDDLSNSGAVPKRLLITNMESPLTEKQAKNHFASIDERTSEIVKHPNDATKRFARSLDFYLVQDFTNAIEDLTQAINCNSSFFPAYFNRSLIRWKQLDYEKSEEEKNAAESQNGPKKVDVKVPEYNIVKSDLDKVIQLAPDFVYAYYNRGNVLCMLKDYRSALADYDKAISLDPNFAEAYFNRGLTNIFSGNNKKGISDLSKAGELGIVSAYNVIKRFTEQKQ